MSAYPLALRNPPATQFNAAFWRWFGQSKVVDGQGQPLVVYHGTPDARGIFSEGFKAFSRGEVWFATDSYAAANSYADDHRAFDYQNAEPAVIPLFLSIQNPMVIDAGGKKWRETEKHVTAAKAGGYDGITIKNSRDFYENTARKPLITVYAWFNPAQAKSALTGPLISRVDRKPIAGTSGNRGTWDASDPDMRNPAEPAPEGMLFQNPGDYEPRPLLALIMRLAWTRKTLHDLHYRQRPAQGVMEAFNAQYAELKTRGYEPTERTWRIASRARRERWSPSDKELETELVASMRPTEAPVQGELTDYQPGMLFQNPKVKGFGSFLTEDQARKRFGLTNDPYEAGFVLSDGDMLDFSEKRDGGSPGVRSLDHRAVVYDSNDAEKSNARSHLLMRFCETYGAIRSNFTGNMVSIDVFLPITYAQRRVLQNFAGERGSYFTVDVLKRNGDYYDSVATFEENVTEDRMEDFVNGINQHFGARNPIQEDTDLLGTRFGQVAGPKIAGTQLALFGEQHQLTPEERAASAETEKWRKKREKEAARGQGDMFANPGNFTVRHSVRRPYNNLPRYITTYTYTGPADQQTFDGFRAAMSDLGALARRGKQFPIIDIEGQLLYSTYETETAVPPEDQVSFEPSAPSGMLFANRPHRRHKPLKRRFSRRGKWKRVVKVQRHWKLRQARLAWHGTKKKKGKKKKMTKRGHKRGR